MVQVEAEKERGNKKEYEDYTWRHRLVIPSRHNHTWKSLLIDLLTLSYFYKTMDGSVYITSPKVSTFVTNSFLLETTGCGLSHREVRQHSFEHRLCPPERQKTMEQLQQ